MQIVVQILNIRVSAHKPSTLADGGILFKIPQAVKDKWGPEAEEWARTTPKVEE